MAFLFARLNYFFAGASAAGAGAAFLSAAGAALLSAGFTAALGSAAAFLRSAQSYQSALEATYSPYRLRSSNCR